MAPKVYNKLTHGIRYWLLRRLPVCQQTVEILSQSMDRRLTLRERIGVRIHLWTCAWCQWYVEHLRVIRDAARVKASEAVDLNTSPGLSNEARERIKAKLSGGN